jgi:hypothetical protein
MEDPGRGSRGDGNSPAGELIRYLLSTSPMGTDSGKRSAGVLIVIWRKRSAGLYLSREPTPGSSRYPSAPVSDVQSELEDSDTRPQPPVDFICLLSSPQLGFFLHLLLRNPPVGTGKTLSSLPLIAWFFIRGLEAVQVSSHTCLPRIDHRTNHW